MLVENARTRGARIFYQWNKHPLSLSRTRWSRSNFEAVEENGGAFGRTKSLVSFFQSPPLEPPYTNRSGGRQDDTNRSPYDRIAEGMGLIMLGTILSLFGIARIYGRGQESNGRPDQTGNEWRWAAVTAIVLIVGWVACIYGMILFLPAVSELASVSHVSNTRTISDISQSLEVTPAAIEGLMAVSGSTSHRNAMTAPPRGRSRQLPLASSSCHLQM